ncbi:MAG: (Fe-S)-binding protein [Candidatus Lokiarchaeota archaeon]|nr:(Fe-S)-binding protein [Candidatus Lokiarchaeota archaeon]
MPEFNEVKKHIEMIEFCGKCGDCTTSGTQITTAKRHVDKPCPVKNVLGFEAYDARGRIIILKNLLKNKLKVDDSILNWAYTCTQCGSCKETCLAIEGGIDTPILMESLRIDLVNQGFKLNKHKEILASVIKNKNPYGEPLNEKQLFLKGKKFNQDSKNLLFLGCTSSYRQQELAIAAINLLENLGIDFQILEDENCCGSVLKRYGFVKDFEDIAKSNLNELKEKNITNIIFPCAGCYRTFKLDYEPFNNASFKFYHLVEFLEEYLNDKSFKFKLNSHKKITYHDPCHLGRHCGVYEAPRNLLKNIQNSTFIEFDALRNFSHCCGAGGGVKSSNPDLALKTALNRLQEAKDKSVEIIISSCPFCEKNLKDGINEGINDIEILDITEFLFNSLKKDLSSQIVVDEGEIESNIGKEYMNFLAKYPEIFADLTESSILDFAIYNGIDDLEEEKDPAFKFNVLRTGGGIEIKPGGADEPDLELALSINAVEKLIKNKTKNDYAEQFGLFYNEPDEEEGWIDFILHKRTKTLIKMGYGKFAEEAGILDDESEVD